MNRVLFKGVSLKECKDWPFINDEHMLGDSPGRWPKAE
jgi:hypothetical protein